MVTQSGGDDDDHEASLFWCGEAWGSKLAGSSSLIKDETRDERTGPTGEGARAAPKRISFQ